MRKVMLLGAGWLELVVLSACGQVASHPPGDGAIDIDATTGPATITFTHQLGSGQPGNTDLLAYQDGDGPWQVVAGSAGVYKLTVTTGRYGVVTACKRASDGSAFVNLGYYAVSDGTSRFGLGFCAGAAVPRVTISGTVAGAAAAEQIWISDGVSSAEGPPASWSMPAAQGPGTLIGMRLSAERPVGMLLQRVQFAMGATFSLDFAQQFFPSESDLTLDPTAGMPFMTTSYIDEAGGRHRIDSASSAVTKYRVVPADRVGNGISLLFASGGTTTTSRSVQRAFKSPVAQTLTLPPAFLPSVPPRIAATAPYPILEVALPRRAGASYYEVNYGTFIPGKFQIWDTVYSAAWVNAAAGSDLQSRLPDVSKLPGWIADFGLGTTGTRSWSVSVVTGPGRLMPGAAAYAAQGGSTAAPAEGDETTASSSSGTYQ
jgi:hypothetical protein